MMDSTESQVVRLLVIQNDRDKSAGRVGDSLADSGAALTVVFPSDPMPALDGFDGLVALPGLADPVDPDPSIDATRSLISRAVERGLPVLGLCLGGQLLAQATGGSVYRCEDELGYREVESTVDAGDDPLFSRAPERFSAFHAHRYAFEPPSGANELVRNDVCVQAFRLGESIWAIQFHPETTLAWVEQLAANIRNGAEGTPARTAAFFRSSGLDPEELVRSARAADDSASSIARQIGAGFAECCRVSRDRPAEARAP